MGKIPLNYFIAFCSYSLILLLEKVAFDSHSLLDGEHHHHSHEDNEKLEPFIKKDSHEEEHQHLDDENQEQEQKHEFTILKNLENRKSSLEKKGEIKSSSFKSEENNILIEEPKENVDLDIDEETIKNIVSTKGKFASYLQNRNICIYY